GGHHRRCRRGDSAHPACPLDAELPGLLPGLEEHPGSPHTRVHRAHHAGQKAASEERDHLRAMLGRLGAFVILVGVAVGLPAAVRAQAARVPQPSADGVTVIQPDGTTSGTDRGDPGPFTYPADGSVVSVAGWWPATRA